MSDGSLPFLALLHRGLQKGGFETDDVLASLLPLFRQVSAAHERGLVAPLKGLQQILVSEDGSVSVSAESFTKPVRVENRVNEMLAAKSRGVEVIGESRTVTDMVDGIHESKRADVLDQGEEVKAPAFICGYTTWEHALGHHDPVTDVLSLGMLLASLACGLDFTVIGDVEMFASQRANLFAINRRLHPVVARVIVQMTELDRHKRAQDVSQLLRCLESYRDQPIDLDLSKIKADAVTDRRRLIQEHLRDRLFEISRRNRLIYYKPTLQSLNLTVSSVPLVMDVRNIRPEQLFIWHHSVASDLSKGNAIALGKYLRSEDAPYIPGILDKIISEARRDKAEYGFAQLRLVICFLRWHNLKEQPDERIHSPLLLLPVELTKRKGVKDSYILTPTTNEAEVNPALRHHLKTLYGIVLPEIVDLDATPLEQFHETLQSQIRASEPGVTLEKIDRPKIELIHARARQRLDQWKQRQRARPIRTEPLAVEYSYDRENYRPKGLQLFLGKVRPQPCPLADMAGAAPRPRLPGWVADVEPAGPTVETEREMYSLRDGDSGNPYHWAFDLCSLTLGNFHYRKMTLVRDYTKLAEGVEEHVSFDSVFSLEPKSTEDAALGPLPLREQYPIIPCDSAQAAAVARSRTGRSFIIQGPPGTGKSQTITNLIADYVARGKRVLFVCEKRAAIDVVFHRLRQQGLDELCCLIHDSQADKKEFIQNLKQTYEQWLTIPPDDEAVRARDRALAAIEHDLAALDRFSKAMTHSSPDAGVGTRRLAHRLIEIRDQVPALDASAADILPVYKEWLRHGSLVERLQQSLATLGAALSLAEHPLRWLGREVILSPRPIEKLQQELEAVEPMLDAIESNLELTGLPEELWDTLPEIASILDYAKLILPLAGSSKLSLLDPASPLSGELQRLLAELVASDKKLSAAREAAKHWREPLVPADTINALEASKQYEQTVLRFLQPAFWRLRKTVRHRYDFAQHAVEPSLRKVLDDLRALQEAQQHHEQLEAKFSAEFTFCKASGVEAFLGQARGSNSRLEGSQEAFREILVADPNGAELVRSLAAMHADYERFQRSLKSLLSEQEMLEFESLPRVLAGLRTEVKALPDLLPLLTELFEAPESMRYALLNSAVRLDQFEAAIAHKSFQRVLRADLNLNRFDGRLLEAFRSRLEEHQRGWLKVNAAVIRDQVRRKFREHVQISGLPAAQLTEEQKLFKKNYASGRRELEHEFGKTMRFKSIRDLVANASGDVVRDLKPIWLMSPLSVSDTLPLDPDIFDVVIYDEASQIPVEEAVPGAYRARQVIVVGDEMQLPPTSFFVAGKGDESEDEAELDRVEVDLDADSFLSQSARNLPSTLLAWHYRSRYENLISFSNAAFYSGNLFTIPDRHLPPETQVELKIRDTSQGSVNVDALLARSISFHFLENGCYENRRNTPEAQYIAQMVRELLRRETKLSIGIVAFSEAQQTEIERALDDLGEDDKVFGERLEAEMNREEDDQFCGLFVKNLENVQGDERDIIILSICYGYDREKKMLMNFGPINQRGGEKRLNVIFSRARHHMAVISSIKHHDITNDYNDGANALKGFLKYSESLSRGDVTAARSVLEGLNPLNRRALAPMTGRDAVIDQLASALCQRGYSVDVQVGQSRFRCDLGVRGQDQKNYVLGVLVDTDAHYENTDLVDRYLTRPSVLKAFGWNVVYVLTKDWFLEPDAVIERIERLLHGGKPESVPLPDVPEMTSTNTVKGTIVLPQPAPVAVMKPTNQPGRAGVSNPEILAPTSSYHQRLEYIDEGSRKFWEITVAGPKFTVHFGRIGTAGQTQEKAFGTEAEALRGAEQLTKSKLAKGYRTAGA
ncbi:MAG: AAA domain-containing protein [Nibricoccus sp.]